MSNEIYPYITITGTLSCKSDLHLGDGDIQNFSTERSGKIIKGKVNTVCTSDNKPYLPGSSLRGSLTAKLDRTHSDIKKLFGYSDEKHPTDKRGSSKIRLLDAKICSSPSEENKQLPYWCDTRNTWVRHAIAIDPVTATAEQHKFFRYELVPSGTKFALKLKGENLSQKELNIILSLLKKRWNNSTENSLGKGKSKGYGKIKWQLDKVSVVTKASQKIWIQTPEQAQPEYTQPEYNDQLDNSQYENIIHSYQQLALIIHPQSPLLVHEPACVEETANKDDNPKITYARKNGKAVIYPSTLKGAARAHAHRIIATIAHVHYGVKAEDAATLTKPLLNKLFGSTQQRGNIHFAEAISEIITPNNIHRQFFNAIDRFTGKVKEGALYNVEAVNCEKLTATLNIPLGKLNDTDKGILYFLVRDAINGEIAIGWGKSRGYGAIRIALTIDGNAINTAPELNQHIGEDKIENYLKALHQSIKSSVGKQEESSYE